MFIEQISVLYVSVLFVLLHFYLYHDLYQLFHNSCVA